MSPYTSLKLKKAQGALEFAIMFSIVMFFFLAVFIFLTNEFTNIDESAKVARSIARGAEIQDEIIIAARAPIGFTKDFEFYFTDSATKATASFVKDPSGYVREIAVTDELGNAQVIFLPRTIVLRENACDGKNQILRTVDGVGICCDSCNGTLPQQQTLDIACGVFETYYNCTTLAMGSPISSIRTSCPRQGVVFVNITNSTQTVAFNSSRYISGSPYYIVPLSLNYTIGADDYEISSSCYAEYRVGNYAQYSVVKINWTS